MVHSLSAMKTKTSGPTPDVARKKLISQIAAAQKQADHARKAAKLSKLAFRIAKQKFKDARRAAKKIKRTLKALKAELAALAVRKVVRKPAKAKRPRAAAATLAAPVIVPPPAGVPSLIEDLPPPKPFT